ncbi:MAG: hypothetical protein ACXV2I_11680 [Actinomycetes bacterium]
MTTTDERRPGEAKADWEARIALRSDEASRVSTPDLPPPSGLRPEPGVGHVRLSWQPVGGAVGYLAHRGPEGARAASLQPVDHQGGDVLSVPDLWYVDTTGDLGTALHVRRRLRARGHRHRSSRRLRDGGVAAGGRGHPWSSCTSTPGPTADRCTARGSR